MLMLKRTMSATTSASLAAFGRYCARDPAEIPDPLERAQVEQARYSNQKPMVAWIVEAIGELTRIPLDRDILDLVSLRRDTARQLHMVGRLLMRIANHARLDFAELLRDFPVPAAAADAYRADLMIILLDQRKALCEVSEALGRGREDWRLTDLPGQVSKQRADLLEAGADLSKARAEVEAVARAAGLWPRQMAELLGIDAKASLPEIFAEARRQREELSALRQISRLTGA